MPDFCADCNHDRRDHFDDEGCSVSVLYRFTPRWWSRLRRLLYWGTCPCTTYVPEED